MFATLWLLAGAPSLADDGPSIWDQEEEVQRLDHEPGWQVGILAGVQSPAAVYQGLGPPGIELGISGSERLNTSAAWIAVSAAWTPRIYLPDSPPRIWEVDVAASLTARNEEAGVFDLDVWGRSLTDTIWASGDHYLALRSTAGAAVWLPLGILPTAQLGLGGFMSVDAYDYGTNPWFVDPGVALRSRLTYGAQGRDTVIVGGRHALTAAASAQRTSWVHNGSTGFLSPARPTPSSGAAWRATLGWAGPVAGKVLGVAQLGYGQARFDRDQAVLFGADGMLATAWLVWAPGPESQISGGVHLGHEAAAWTELRQIRCAAVEAKGQLIGPIGGQLHLSLLRDDYLGLTTYEVLRLRTGLELAVAVKDRITLEGRGSWERQVSAGEVVYSQLEYDAVAAWAGVTVGPTNGVRPTGTPDLEPSPKACRDAWSAPVPGGTGGAWPYRTSATPGSGERPRTQPIQWSEAR